MMTKPPSRSILKRAGVNSSVCQSISWHVSERREFEIDCQAGVGLNRTPIDFGNPPLEWAWSADAVSSGFFTAIS